MEELKENYWGWSREKQLEMAQKWLAKTYDLVAVFEYKEATVYAKKAIDLFERLKVWEKLIEARLQNIYTWRMLRSKDILEDIESFVETTLELYHTKLPLIHELGTKLFQEISLYYSDNDDFSKGLHYALQQLEVVKQLDKSDYKELVLGHRNISVQYQFMGDFPKSIFHGVKALEICKEEKDKILFIKIALPLYVNYAKYGDFENAFVIVNQALRTANELKEKKVKMPIYFFLYIYNNLASYYNAIGDHQEAVLNYKKALSIAIEKMGAENWRTAIVQKNLGRTLIRSQQFNQAGHYLKNALEIQEKLYGSNHSELAFIHFSLAEYHKATNNLLLFLDHAQRALEIFRRIFDEPHPNVLKAYKLTALAHSKMGNEEETIRILENLITQVIDFWGENHIETAMLYKELANHYLQSNQIDLALKTIYQSASILLKREKKERSNAAKLTAMNRLFPIICLKGQIFFQYFLQNSTAKKHLQDSIAAFEQAIQILCTLQQSYHNDWSKLIWNDNHASLFEEGIIAALEAKEVDINGDATAFQFSEKAKASLLLTSIQTKFAQTTVQLPLELLEQEKQIKIELTYLDKRIQQLQAKKEKEGLKEQESISLKKCQDDFFYLHQSYTSFLQELETNYPNYYQLKYDTKTVSIDEVRETLVEGQTLISYFIGEESIYIFVLTSNEFEIEELKKPDDFEGMIHRFLNTIHAHHKETYLQLAHQLYELLIAPVELHFYNPLIALSDEEAVKQELILIPHAELSYLPFEALMSEKAPENTSYQELNYLVEEYEISYHYSATLWYNAQQNQGKRAKTEHSFVGFAPVYQAERANAKAQETLTAAANDIRSWATRSEALRSDGSWTPLPHSKEEAENIAHLFEKKGLDAATYLHEKATKEQFQKAVGKARYLLVAAHGVVNDEKTVLSGLVFYPNEKREKNKEEIFSTVVDIENSWNDDRGEDLSSFANVDESLKDDCILSMEETYPLNINADLVVLSSCESGIGKLHKGEGMMAVNRGFLAAGAKNVISTLFKVYDKPSSLLTQYLFEYILEGDSYRTALRKAKLRLMQLEGVSPKSWCGFVLIGG